MTRDQSVLRAFLAGSSLTSPSEAQERSEAIRYFVAARLIFLSLCLWVMLVGLAFPSIWQGLIGEPKTASNVWAAWLLGLVATLIVGWSRDQPISESSALLSGWLISLSFPLDALAIYMVIKTVPSLRVLYNAVYPLLAFHAYVFPSYSRTLWQKHRLLGYLVSGGTFGIAVSTILFWAVHQEPGPPVALLIEVGWQVLIVVTLVTLQRRARSRFKTLRGVKEAEAALFESLQSVASIARTESESGLTENLQAVCDQLGENLHAEYCAIGLCNDGVVEDKAWYLGPTRHDRQQGILETLEQNRTQPLDSSLIGTALTQDEEVFQWDQRYDGNILDPSNPSVVTRNIRIERRAAEQYRDEILASHQLRHILVVKVLSERVPDKAVGYIHLVNRIEESGEPGEVGFSMPTVNRLRTVSKQLAVALDNVQTQRRERDLREEAEFFARLIFETNVKGLLEKTLQRLNSIADSRLASFWFPVEDSLLPRNLSAGIVLQYVVASAGYGKGRDRDLEEQLTMKRVFSREDCFVDEFFGGPKARKEIDLLDDVRKVKNVWSEFEEAIQAPCLLVIPVPNLSLRSREWDVGEPNAAVVCLRPRARSFRRSFTGTRKDQLERFARHMGVLLRLARLQERYQQFEMLAQHLQKLPLNDQEQFHENVARMVKEVLKVEEASLFLVDRVKNLPTLRATTAEKIEVATGAGWLERSVAETLAQPPTDECLAKVTDTALDNGVRGSLDAVDGYPRLLGRIREKPSSGTLKSVLVAPLRTRQRDRPLGLLRCVNRKGGDGLASVFQRFDRELLGLVADVLAPLIEQIEMNAERRRFLRGLAHEIRTPLHALRNQIDWVDDMHHRRVHPKDPRAEFEHLRSEVAVLDFLVRDLSEFYAQAQGYHPRYNWSGAQAIYDIIMRVQKLLKPDARFDRQIDIRFLPPGGSEGEAFKLPGLHVDAMRLEQVLFNLLSNAVKYSNKGEHDIWIRYERGRMPEGAAEEESALDDWHLLSVDNWGKGVQKGEEGRIFEEYERGSNAVGSGSGIGLTISRHIVERHCGRLLLTRSHKPTTFTIALPGWLDGRSPAENE